MKTWMDDTRTRPAPRRPGSYPHPPRLDKSERRKRRRNPDCPQDGLMMIRLALFGMDRRTRHARAGALFLFAIFIGPSLPHMIGTLLTSIT